MERVLGIGGGFVPGRHRLVLTRRHRDKTSASDLGKFACLTDPEGNRVELWGPPV
ncbi:MAG: hypothetical protein QGG14_03080 [Planctomycetota bacterium]|jgi:hypothetical protein|nr:hypothetical protein [Planctomycetota bacterium]